MLRRTAVLAIAPFAAVLALGVAPPALDASSPSASSPSDEECAAFNDYFQVTFAAAFLTGFADAFDETTTSGSSSGGDGVGADQFSDVFLLLLSPKLEQSTALLAKDAPKSLRPLFADQRDVYREGVGILRDDLGLSKQQIALIRDADFTQATPDDLEGELDITEDDLAAAATQFGKSSSILTAEDATAKQKRAFERLATDCGSLPDRDVDCGELVGVDLQERLLGDQVVVDDSGGTCTYSGEAMTGSPDPEIAVDVYRTADTFGRLTEQSSGAEAIDEDNATANGFASFSSFKTCGRTLYAKAADTTIVVALCLPDDAPVSDADLTEVRDEVEKFVG